MKTTTKSWKVVDDDGRTIRRCVTQETAERYADRNGIPRSYIVPPEHEAEKYHGRSITAGKVHRIAEVQARAISRQRGVARVVHLGFVGRTSFSHYELEVVHTRQMMEETGVSGYTVSISL